MNTLSLITDFGLRDNFVGVMKAVISKINPLATIIDVCHEVPSQDILEAAFLLKSSFKYSPYGTVHLVVVDPGVGSKRKIIAVRTKNYSFVAPDNGVLALALKDEPPIEIIQVTKEKYFLKPISDTFHGRDIFAPVAAYLSRGEPIKNFGGKIKSFKELELPVVKKDAQSLTGEVIYIDRFGNLISNIDRDLLHNFIKKEDFAIHIAEKAINKISHAYSEVGNQEPLALVGSFNYLEIAVNCGSAQDHFGVGIGEKITIKK